LAGRANVLARHATRRDGSPGDRHRALLSVTPIVVRDDILGAMRKETFERGGRDRAALPSRTSVCIKSLRVCVAAAASLGLAPERSLAALGVGADLLVDPAARVPHDLVMTAWHEIPGRVVSPSFGLHASRLATAWSFDVLDHALAHCATMRDALEVLLRYQRLLHDAIDLRLELAGPGESRLSIGFRVEGAVAAAFVDYITAQWIHRGNKLVGAPPPALRLALARPPPDDEADHLSTFGCPITFGARSSTLWFDAAYLDRPLLAPDPSLASVLLRHASDLLAALPESDRVATAVRRHLTATLDLGPPSIAATARALGVSARSLQRQLAHEQTSFLTVLDDVRRSLAERYLRDHAHTVSDVAFLVGFSELSTFSRAFRRWTGTTAVSYRRGGPRDHET
jgi:AraC-like DNA-binding protein